MYAYRLVYCAALLWVSMLLSSCQGAGPHGAPSPAAQTPAVVEVDAVRVRVATLDDDISAVGSFRAITEANVSPKAGGLVVDVPVRMGQFVPAGAVLIKLDTRDIEAQLAQDRADIEAEQTKLGLTGLNQTLRSDADAPSVRKARATLENARLQWERNRNLYRADLIAQKDLQDSKAQYLASVADYQSALESVQTNKANVQLKRAQLAVDEQKLLNCVVHAPFSGYVASRNVNPGDFVQPGGQSANNEYMKIVTIDPIYATMQIPEIYSQRLRAGQILAIKTVAWPKKVFKGQISHVSPALDSSTRTVKVDATLANPEHLLKPGLYGNVRLTLGQLRGVRMVPQVSQVEQAGQTRVFLVEHKDGAAVARSVVIDRGIVQGGWVQAEDAAFPPSTLVVATNMDRLYDGARIKVGRVLATPPPVPQLGTDASTAGSPDVGKSPRAGP